ncbi:hypothetical protein T492DRAFT_1048174 [Pavlovales sp. CCMP2436]|nr:hypothetical protein T492DRAFT_1048174 [Pavlovales sp. CCMP2436]
MMALMMALSSAASPLSAVPHCRPTSPLSALSVVPHCRPGNERLTPSDAHGRPASRPRALSHCHSRLTATVPRRVAATRAAIACLDRRKLSDEDIASLRAEYAEWIARDPTVRKPLFDAQVQRARQLSERLRERELRVAEQLAPLLAVLSTWQALTGVPFVENEQISIWGWALTGFAALVPVAALQLVSDSGRQAVAAFAGRD